MDELKSMKKKLMSIIKKKKIDSTTALPVRVNLPHELGGGFTMLMCFLAGGQSVSDFIRNLISMLQNTNSILLHHDEYGLTPHAKRDEDGLDENNTPPVFLHPSSLLADAFGEEEELNLDLRRLKPLKKTGSSSFEEANGQSKAASSSSSSSTSGSSSTPATDAFTAMLSTLPRYRPPPIPTPPSHHVLHYTTLAKLKRLKPPADPPAEVIITSTLVPPCTIKEELQATLPGDMRTRNGLGIVANSAAAGGVPATPASSSSATSSEAKKAAKAAEAAQKKLEEYAAHVYDLLLARGIGEDPAVRAALHEATEREKERTRTASSAVSQNDEERIGKTEANAWSGWDEEPKVQVLEQSIEIPLLFVSTAKVPTPLPKKFDITNDSFVITTHRCIQITNGKISEELYFGSNSGTILKLPKDTDDGTPGKCPIKLIVKNAVELEREEFGVEQQQVYDYERMKNNGYSSSLASSQHLTNYQQPISKHVTFYVPNTDIAGYLEEYLMYYQDKLSLELQLSLLEQARLDRLEHSRTERCLRGWTYLLKSLVGPIIFGPLRQPVYENSIKQVLAKVQQMDLKQVKLISLKLLEFKIPELNENEMKVEEMMRNGMDGGANGGMNKNGNGNGASSSSTPSAHNTDQIPSLRLSDYHGHPYHIYTFDIAWNAPSFYIKLEITGKKIVSFKLELEMRGVEVRGSLRLRSSPYEPEKSAVSFSTLPSISFGVGSHIIVGNIKLPFQRAIEKLIYTQIQAAIETGLRENIVGDKWQSIYYEKSGLSLLLDRWWGISQYPFKYDGTDDEDMMSLALIVTTQAESGLSETVKEMRMNRDKMQAYLGMRQGTNAGGAIIHQNLHTSSISTSSSSSSSSTSGSSTPQSQTRRKPNNNKNVSKEDIILEDEEFPSPTDEPEPQPTPVKKKRDSASASASSTPNNLSTPSTLEKKKSSKDVMK